jgi:hypothetical protein
MLSAEHLPLGGWALDTPPPASLADGDSHGTCTTAGMPAARLHFLL